MTRIREASALGVLALVGCLLTSSDQAAAAAGQVWEGFGSQGDIHEIRLHHLGGRNYKLEYPTRGCSTALRLLEWIDVGGEITEGKFAERVIEGRCAENSRIKFKLPTDQADGTWEIQSRFGSISAGTFKAGASGAGVVGAPSATGNSIADAFHGDSVSAIKRYSTWGEISLVERETPRLCRGGSKSLT